MTRTRDDVTPRRPDVWRVLSCALVAALLFLTARYGADAGVIWDELLQAEYGDRVLAWFGSGFTDRRALAFEDLYLYGGLFEAAAQWTAAHSPAGLYETRHYLTACLAVAGIAISGATAGRIAGPRAGFFAALILALTPAWVGHGLFNPKDVPFAALASAVTWASATIATGPAPVPWASALAANAALGLALAVRPGGWFLIALPLAGVVAGAWRGARLHASPGGGDMLRSAIVGIGRCAALVPLAWALMLSAWPWAQLAPLSRPIEAMRAASRFHWDGTMLFAGGQVRSTALPAGYLPTWFAITTPEMYGVCLLLGLTALVVFPRARPGRDAAGAVPVLLAVCGPMAGALWTRPVLYDGLRHFLFVFPGLSVLAALSFERFLDGARPALWRAAGVTLFAAAALLAAHDAVVLHPYEYVYFNRPFGGTAAAVGRYETDYWGATYREGLAWTLSHLSRLREDGPTRVAACNDNANRRLEYYRQHWPGAAERIQIAPDYAGADVFLAVTRYDCHRQPGQVVHVVARANAPLLYVIRTGSR